MRSHLFSFVFAILALCPVFAQDSAAAEQAFANMKSALGGEAQLHLHPQLILHCRPAKIHSRQRDQNRTQN